MIYYLNDSIYFKANEYSNICCKVDAKNWGKNSNFNYEIKTLMKILEYALFGLSENKNIFYKDINQKNLTFIYKYGIIIIRWKGDASLNTDWFFCFLENQARQFICNKKVKTSRGFGFFLIFLL